MPDTMLCPFCKEEIKFGAVKCKHCGSMLGDVTVVATSDATTTVRLALAAKYEILEEVGRGGMAIVFKAVQKNLDRVVALKALPPQFQADKEFLERFHREARSAAKLHHPNIIVVHDEGVESGVHYLSMEFLEGTDLFRLIGSKGRLSLEDTIAYVAPIADALDYAHKHGLVHRDVKSSNIYVTPQRRPVLMDFGIAHAKAATQLTVVGQVIGTPEFMSPEQAAGKQIDGRSDLFSLGIVLYHCLTGRMPFTSDNPLTTIFKVMNETYIPAGKIASVPSWMEVLLARCLEKDADRRIQSGRELAEALKSRTAQTHVPAIDLAATIDISRKTPKEERPKARPAAAPAQPPRNGAVARGGGMSALTKALIAAVVVAALAGGGYSLYRAGVFLPSEVVIPSLVGLAPAEARLRIERLELKLGLISGPTDGRLKVSAQNPGPGTKVPPETPVYLTVVKDSVSVPDVKGRTPEQAAAILKAAGLVVTETFPRAGAPEERGRVVVQIPEAGERAEDGAGVTLIVGG